MTLTIAQLQDRVERLASEPERWADLIQHDQRQRTYALLHEDADLSVWLLC
jgi:hypothetical protein